MKFKISIINHNIFYEENYSAVETLYVKFNLAQISPKLVFILSNLIFAFGLKFQLNVYRTRMLRNEDKCRMRMSAEC